jgi:carbon monoxide dehydrogenase subunit G
VDLNHTFTVPADKATAWAAFEDIRSVAECFPGATVTEAEGDEFKGTCKVKLGPIALQYSGSGAFLERDADAGRLVFDATGRDKRGNGTAGAKVTATFHEEGPASTRVAVHTDMQITGKPAQFGRGVMQDVSDKLLEQFVECLQQKVGAPEPAVEEAAAAESAVPPPTDVEAGEAGEAPTLTAVGSSGAPGATTGGPRSTGPVSTSPTGGTAANNDTLNLGATVLPVLLKSYGKQVAAVIGVLLVLKWLLGRRHRD